MLHFLVTIAAFMRHAASITLNGNNCVTYCQLVLEFVLVPFVYICVKQLNQII